MVYKNARLILVAGLVAASAAWAADPPIASDKQVIVFETKTGVVTFRHQNHADLSFTTCKTCHHTQEGDGPIQGCHECHHDKDEGAAIQAKKAFHLRCAGCHEYTIKERLLDHAGPLKAKCKLCHIK